MAETDLHRALMFELIETLQHFFARMLQVYVTGNLLVFYEEGNRRRHVSPDVFVVRGVPNEERINYLIWEEGKGPEFVIELTSSSTQNEDVETKFALYRDVLKVKEYFLFDPFGDFLTPRLQGYRLMRGEYRPIREIDGRLPSSVTKLHLETDGRKLRLHDPATGKRLPTHSERTAIAEAAKVEAESKLTESERERERLQREVEDLKRLLNQRGTVE